MHVGTFHSLYLVYLVKDNVVVLVYTVLHMQITPICLSVCLLQRKDYRVLTECLPSKHEYVLKIRLSPVQEQLYCALLKQRGSDGVIQSIFKFFQTMMRVSRSAGLATDCYCDAMQNPFLLTASWRPSMLNLEVEDLGLDRPCLGTKNEM